MEVDTYSIQTIRDSAAFHGTMRVWDRPPLRGCGRFFLLRESCKVLFDCLLGDWENWVPKWKRSWTDYNFVVVATLSVPESLRGKEVAVAEWELSLTGRDSRLVYADWCGENGWPERENQLRTNSLATTG